ncbi:MAG TPA: hypothetical protein VKE74_27710 [Gemmataceae bacterium]|nr:hypothetical protein [Gemmataceae bacterium]
MKTHTLDNCVHVGEFAHEIDYGGPHPAGAELRYTRNTVVATGAAVDLVLARVPAGQDSSVKPMRVETSHNVFDCGAGLRCFQASAMFPSGKPLEPGEARSLLPRLLLWRDRTNVYAPAGCSVLWAADQPGATAERVAETAQWKQFWGQPDADIAEGTVRYQGGNVLFKVQSAPDQLTPEDFRLRPDSAGYRAGKDGKDLGADLDLVGPGRGYERWKKTPEYQQWLKETGQMK